MRDGPEFTGAVRLGGHWRLRLPALGAVAIVTLYLSTQMLFQPRLFEYWTISEVAVAWLEDFVELAMVATAMLLAYVAVQGLGRTLPVPIRRTLLVLALFTAALAVLLAEAALRNHLAVPPDFGLAVATALRYGLVGSFLVLAEALWNRTHDINSLVRNEQAAADELEREGQRMRLNVLRAQIEPHFLFNTLAALRRLYRTEPRCAARTMASLQRYLRAALPDLRREDTTLTDELELVSAYLELMTVRMGARLSHSVCDDSRLGDMTFPPLVILTLVENAIKHGIEPAREGGRVDVCTTRLATGALRVEVRDTGVGLSGAPAGGTGLGLANIRSRLAARYGSAARLRLTTASPGVLATVDISAAALV
jgi:signal transduction histidine kinase